MTLPSEALLADRRSSPRQAVSRVVTVEPSPNMPGQEALVTNISRDGARLFVRDIELPETFALIFADTRERRECKVVWRIGPELGVAFVDTPASGKRRTRRTRTSTAKTTRRAGR